MIRIAVLPLDERPVNAKLPGMVAAIAGAEVETPGRSLLPRMRVPGDPAGLVRWTEQVGAAADAMVVSLDMLGYGGLIASRTSDEPLEHVVERLGALRRIRAARPDLPVGAVTTVMRASHSYSAGEEPEYWTEYGVELHRLGGALHARYLGEPDGRGAVEELRSAVPAGVRGDFLGRRLRNHAVDLLCLGLAASGIVRPLLITADDTAARAAGTLEQVWLSHWMDALELAGSAWSYPGADEVCAALTARALVGGVAEPPRIAVVVPEPGGGSRIAPYENVPVEQTVANQVRAAGGQVIADPARAEAILVVHAPDPADGEAGVAEAAVEEVATAVADLVGLAGRGPVGLADVRRPNGSDPELVERLVRDGTVEGLAAYGGWNTAGNTIGSVVAALVAGVVGRRTGGHDPVAERRLLLHRLVEDFGYQAVARTALCQEEEYAGHVSVPFDRPELAERYRAACVPRLERVLDDLGEVGSGWSIARTWLPWNRAFEIDFDVVGEPVHRG